MLCLTRRCLIAGLSSVLSLDLTGPVRAAEVDLGAIERRHGGRLGVYAIDTETGRSLSHRADERFTMCSTFKGLLAALILSRVDAGQESLTRIVRYDKNDLSAAGYPDFAAPVTAANLEQGALTVGTLCQAIVETSDNLAAILLMRSIGGPEGLTRFARGLGDMVTRSDRYEPASNDYDGILDTTTPRAILGAARTILLGNVLTRQSQELLESWMIDAKPGLRRLRSPMPSDWRVGDKTGTSGDETNDYAIVRPPGRAPLLVTAYYNAPKLDLDAREAVLREVGTIFVRWAG